MNIVRILCSDHGVGNNAHIHHVVISQRGMDNEGMVFVCNSLIMAPGNNTGIKVKTESMDDGSRIRLIIIHYMKDNDEIISSRSFICEEKDYMQVEVCVVYPDDEKIYTYKISDEFKLFQGVKDER